MKGQVTLFVIVGLVALILVGFMFAIRSSLEARIGETGKLDYLGFDNAEGILKSSVSDCMVSIARDAISIQGMQAGHLNSSSEMYYGEEGATESRPFEGFNVPIVSSSAGSTLLSLEQVGRRICNKVYLDLNECINLEFFNENGYEITTPAWSESLTLAQSHCEASIRQESVAIRVTHPVELRKEDFSIAVNEFVALIPISLGSAYSFAEHVSVNAPLSSPGTIPFGFEVDCEKLHPSLTIHILDEGNIVRLIESNPSSIDAFIFQFAIQDFSIEGDCVA